MKVKPWKIHLFRRGCGIKTIKPDENPLVQFDIDLRGATSSTTSRQELCFETS
jgi:hypothetical protein